MSMSSPADPHRRVELIESAEAYRGYFRIDRLRLRHSLHRGGMSDPLVREVFDRGQVVAVLLVDPDRDLVVLIEQFRPGPYAVGWDPWLIECVAGVIEPGESPAGVARREAVEETGCAVTDLFEIARFTTSPGACSETVTLFCGRVDARRAGGVHGLASEGEDIRVEAVPVTDALRMVDEGRIVNAKTLIALQWLALDYDRVKARWRHE